MSVITTSFVATIFIFSSSVLGLIIQKFVPKEHLSDQSKDTLKASRGVIIGVAALTLGLLISASKTSYDSKTDEIRLQAAKIVTLNRILNDYGPEASRVRTSVHTYIEEQISHVDRIFSFGASIDEVLKSSKIISLRSIISTLSPKTPDQQFLKTSALGLSNEIEELRWRVYEELGSHLQWPMFYVLVFWLMCIFFSLGIVAPYNFSVVSGLFLAALSMGGAIYLLLELDRPYQGLITISSEPLRVALKVLDYSP